MKVLASALAIWGLLGAMPLVAQVRSSSDGQLTVSLGQPERWKWHGGAATGWIVVAGRAAGVLDTRLGVYKDVSNPTLGIMGVDVEGYLNGHNEQISPGLRARLVSPVVRLGLGADYNAREDRFRFVVSAYSATRRGGLFRDGSLLRADFSPGPTPSITIGFEAAIHRKAPMGRTRPRVDHVDLRGSAPRTLRPAEVPATVDNALSLIRARAQWIRRVNVPFLDAKAGGWQSAQAVTAKAMRQLKDSLVVTAPSMTLRSRNFDDEVRAYHTDIERAFSLAIGDAPRDDGVSDGGARAASMARAILFSEVLIPYDRLLGQEKKPDHLDPFTRRARGVFVRWLELESGVPRERTDAVLWVFASLLDIVEANRAAARKEYGDSRFVWLPLQYALRPEDADTQAELDAILEAATAERFTDGNVVSYVINEQFQAWVNTTIREARDYHVLWTHDVRGYDDVKHADGKHPDEMSFRQVVGSYLATMTARVRQYDSTGKFPTYIILLDQWFYEVNTGRLWMSLLEDPTRHRVRLPAGFSAWEDSIARMQQRLRGAIDSSRLLQAQRRQFGDAWLRNLIKVHVNITNPADPSFWSVGIVPALSVADNVMRDHRKIAFYDITEEDPYRGMAVFTGAGIGEHYASQTWEDRAVVVSGPSLLDLKTTARNLLLDQGLRPEQIPEPLQPKPHAANYDALIQQRSTRGKHPLRAVPIWNHTGFGLKEINVAKAVLYTLMPSGSVIKVPDSLWNSHFWGSAFLGAALRGVRAIVIAPCYDNAPADAFGSMIRAQDLFVRLATANEILGPEIASAGGMLKLGLYTSSLHVSDLNGKIRSIQKAFGEQAWLRDLFQFDPKAYAALDQLSAFAGASTAPDTAGDFEPLTSPKLHMKANFFATREAWELMKWPQWGGTIQVFAGQRLGQIGDREKALATFEKTANFDLDPGTGMVEDWVASLSAATRERAVFYALMGSQNQNYRSMVSDGEVALMISNWPYVAPLLDIVSLMSQSKWVGSPSEVPLAFRQWNVFWRVLATRFKLQF